MAAMVIRIPDTGRAALERRTPNGFALRGDSALRARLGVARIWEARCDVTVGGVGDGVKAAPSRRTPYLPDLTPVRVAGLQGGSGGAGQEK